MGIFGGLRDSESLGTEPALLQCLRAPAMQAGGHSDTTDWRWATDQTAQHLRDIRMSSTWINSAQEPNDYDIAQAVRSLYGPFSGTTGRDSLPATCVQW